MKVFYSLVLSMVALLVTSSTSNAGIVVSVDFDSATAGIQSTTAPLAVGDQVTANFVLSLTSASDSLIAYGFDAQFNSALQYVSRSEPQIPGWGEAYLDNQVGSDFALQFDGTTGGTLVGPFSQIVGTLTFKVTQGGAFVVTPGMFNPNPDFDGFIDGNFNDVQSSAVFNSGTINVAAVPEPSSMAALAAVGIGGWVARRRAARKSK